MRLGGGIYSLIPQTVSLFINDSRMYFAIFKTAFVVEMTKIDKPRTVKTSAWREILIY